MEVGRVYPAQDTDKIPITNQRDDIRILEKKIAALEVQVQELQGKVNLLVGAINACKALMKAIDSGVHSLNEKANRGVEIHTWNEMDNIEG